MKNQLKEIEVEECHFRKIHSDCKIVAKRVLKIKISHPRSHIKYPCCIKCYNRIMKEDF